MTRKLQLKRALLLLTFLGAAFAGLGYRLVDLQVVRHDELSALAAQNTQREFWQAPRRGDILDANGNILATSVAVKTVCAEPSLIGNQQAVVARALAPLLNLNEADLCQKLTPRVGKNEKGEIVTNYLHYVRLEKNVSDETWRQIPAGDDEFIVRRGRKKIIQNRPRVFPQFAPERDFRRAGTDADLSKRLARVAGAGIFRRRRNERERTAGFKNFRARRD
jgi:cell division protein FtsI/penicillin-binding protein 2